MFRAVSDVVYWFLIVTTAFYFIKSEYRITLIKLLKRLKKKSNLASVKIPR